MHFFDGWARAIVAGDLLTANGARPYHGRHVTLACQAYVAGGGEAAHCTHEEVVRIWDDWVGKNTLWQDPLYPYSLALLYATLGRSPMTVYAAQSALGLACVALVYLLALRIGDRRAAVAAGLLAALYGPLLFYELVMLRAVSVSALGLLAAYALLRTFDDHRFVWGAGLAAGALCVLKFSWILTVPLWAMLLAAIVWRSGRRRAVVVVGSYLAAVVVGLSGLMVRNGMLGLPLLQSAVTGPLNFINGNAADRVAGGGSAISAHAAAILAETGGEAGATIRATLATYDRLVDWLSLLARKLVTFFDGREIPNNVSYEYFLLHVDVIALVAVGFALVASLAAVGVAVSVYRRRSERLVLLSYITTGVAVCVLFFNLSRFRLPIACMMMPLAGVGYSYLVECAYDRRWTSLAGAVVTVAVVAALVGPSRGPAHEGLRIADYGVANAIAVDLATRAVARGDQALGARIAVDQLRTEPPTLSDIEPGPQSTSISAHLSGVAGTFIDLHVFLADLLAQSPDQAQRAAYHRRRAGVMRALNRPYVAAGID